ncbi:ABC transporter ATP-binding protein/permease [Methylocella tundrae]|nr:ABC transporter ATP-binding protein/permease [Methylocella tundrae]
MTRPANMPPATETREHGFDAQLLMMMRALWASPERNQFLLLAFALCVVVGATAFGQIKLNAWNHPFYDALARKDLSGFLQQLWVFAMIASGLLILNVAQIWLNQITKLKLRARLTRELIDLWLGPRRAFRLANAGEIGVNPDQRIHEDARHLVELTTDLGIGLLQSTLLLASFIGVLWILSDGIGFNLFGHHVAVPGYMVWSALIYAGAASWMSWRVGNPLIQLNAERYGREAELRFALVRVNERNDAIAFYGGEEDEKQRLHNELQPVLDIMRRLVTGVTRLTWITAGYGWFAIVAPIVVAAPGFFSGDLTLGGLMMVVGAFNQVQQALRWFVDNFSAIADWQATLMRVATFRQALVDIDRLGNSAGRIEIAPSTEEKLQFDDLRVASPETCTRLSERHVTIKPGERILIIARPGAGRSNFFSAIAGLWPWGSGRISLPVGHAMMFLSNRPYLPPGTLRAAIAYPSPAKNFEEGAFAAALQRMGLARLLPDLDHSHRWERELGSDEQQSLQFARLLLHKPRWVLINEALDALDEDTRAIVIDLFSSELAGTAVLNIGRPDTQKGFFSRVLHLIEDPHGETLASHLSPGVAATPACDAGANANVID